MDRDAIAARWIDAVLAEYGEETAQRWRRTKDPFRNPVGHALATSLPALLDAVVGGGEPDLRALAEVVRIRAVQEMAPSQAVGFVLKLRELLPEPELQPRIDRLLLLAVDAYATFRERVHRLREEELKRSVSTLLKRWYGESLPQSDLVQLAVRR